MSTSATTHMTNFVSCLNQPMDCISNIKEAIFTPTIPSFVSTASNAVITVGTFATGIFMTIRALEEGKGLLKKTLTQSEIPTLVKTALFGIGGLSTTISSGLLSDHSANIQLYGNMFAHQMGNLTRSSIEMGVNFAANHQILPTLTAITSFAIILLYAKKYFETQPTQSQSSTPQSSFLSTHAAPSPADEQKSTNFSLFSNAPHAVITPPYQPSQTSTGPLGSSSTPPSNSSSQSTPTAPSISLASSIEPTPSLTATSATSMPASSSSSDPSSTDPLLSTSPSSASAAAKRAAHNNRTTNSTPISSAPIIPEPPTKTDTEREDIIDVDTSNLPSAPTNTKHKREKDSTN